MKFQLLSDGSIKVFFKRSYGFIEITSNGNLTNNLFNGEKSKNPFFIVDQTSFAYISNKDEGGLQSFPYKNSTNFSWSYSDSILCLAYNFGLDIIYKSGSKISIQTNNLDIDVGLTNNLVWLASIHGGIDLYTQSGAFVQNILEGKSCTKYFVDDFGGAWITTLESGVFYYSDLDLKQIAVKDDDYITDLLVFGDTMLYIGGYSGGIYKYYNGQITVVGNACTHGVLSYYKYNDKVLFQGQPIREDLNIQSLESNICFLKFSDNPNKKPISIHRNGVYDENLNLLFKLQDQSIMDSEWFEGEIYLGKKNGLT
ncbi:MAG: hypothetical protein WED33_05655, partial [Bacteroidia bacterium]